MARPTRPSAPIRALHTLAGIPIAQVACSLPWSRTSSVVSIQRIGVKTYLLKLEEKRPNEVLQKESVVELNECFEEYEYA